MLFQTWMTYFLLHNIKDGILKTVSNKAVLVTSNFNCMNKKYWDVSQMIIFYVPYYYTIPYLFHIIPYLCQAVEA